MTWLPAGMGSVGIPPLHTWAVLCGYLGVSWLAPALLVRAAARSWVAARVGVGTEAAGWVAGVAAAAACLLAAATIVGT